MIDKPSKNGSKIYWKCEDKNCNGRGNSSGDMNPYRTITQSHELWHEPLFVKREVCETISQFKSMAIGKNRKGNKTRNIFKEVIKNKTDDVLMHLPSSDAFTVFRCL
jgi:hypothetical protein